MNNKGKKTTTVAYIALGLIILSFLGLYLKAITGSELRDLISGIIAATVVVIGILTKDATASHTLDKFGIGGNLPPPQEEEEPV